MKTKTVNVMMPIRFCSGPSRAIAGEGSKYDSKITLSASGKTIDAKSAVSLMLLHPDKIFTITADGVDEDAAIAGMEHVLSAVSGY